MNKNLIYIALFFLGIISFSYFFPVGGAKEKDKFTVMSTTVMIDSVVKEIVGGSMHTSVLIEGEADPHSYQMRKGDREKIYAADLIFANGLSLEHNPSLLYHLEKEKAHFLGDVILAEKPEWIISMNGEVDPHMWMDLQIMQRVAALICAEVCEKDAKNKDLYEKNCRRLQKKMRVLDAKIMSMMKQIPDEKRYLVSSHDAFMYFIRRYFVAPNGERLFSMQGISTEAEISLKRIRQVINYIKSHSITTIFFESNLPKDCILKVMEICETSGMQVKISEDALFGDTLGGMTYLQMMEHDAKVIAKNLRREK